MDNIFMIIYFLGRNRVLDYIHGEKTQ